MLWFSCQGNLVTGMGILFGRATFNMTCFLLASLYTTPPPIFFCLKKKRGPSQMTSFFTRKCPPWLASHSRSFLRKFDSQPWRRAASTDARQAGPAPGVFFFFLRAPGVVGVVSLCILYNAFFLGGGPGSLLFRVVKENQQEHKFWRTT